MPWLEVILDIEAHQVEEISERLSTLGALSVSWQDAQDQPLYEPALNTTPLWKQTRIKGLFEEPIEHSRFNDLPPHHLQILEDRDWQRVCMEDFHPMCFGERLWIYPSWEPPPDPQAINICLDPGVAFGTGTHPTTALCLEWLAQQGNFSGKDIIDYGCGSGILAIAAAKLGARQVWAVDNDPQALAATQDNAQKNSQNAQIRCTLPEHLPPLQVDGLLANILATPLINLAPTLTDYLKKEGILILSGILQEQVPEVIASYQSHFVIQEIVERDQWIRIVAIKL